MTTTEQSPTSGKGKLFFDRGDQLMETGNWEYAIQMFLEGIRREPFNIERGHHPLREAGLKRKLAGGKPAGMFEGKKFKGNDNDGLANAEYLLAKDPGNTSHMVAVLKELEKLQAPADVMKWSLDLLADTMRQAKKPDKKTLTLLVETYTAIKEYAGGLDMADLARRFYPDEAGFEQAAMTLSGLKTITDGQYDRDGSFTKSVKDLKGQIRLNAQDQMAQGKDFLEQEIERARKEYLAAPNVPGKIDNLADTLTKFEQEAYENEAIDVLKKAFADIKAYRFKQRIDDIKIRQMRRRFNQLKAQGNNAAAAELAKEQLAAELAIFAERAANYPTDLSIKYELGRRQLIAGQMDEAIASLQQAQREPKRRVRALSYLGQAFFEKNWYPQAVETFNKALEHEPGEELSKDLHYKLGVCYKAMGDKPKALEHFSTVAMSDYNYRDVRQQVDELRKEVSGEEPSGTPEASP